MRLLWIAIVIIVIHGMDELGGCRRIYLKHPGTFNHLYRGNDGQNTYLVGGQDLKLTLSLIWLSIRHILARGESLLIKV